MNKIKKIIFGLITAIGINGGVAKSQEFENPKNLNPTKIEQIDLKPNYSQLNCNLTNLCLNKSGKTFQIFPI